MESQPLKISYYERLLEIRKLYTSCWGLKKSKHLNFIRLCGPTFHPVNDWHSSLIARGLHRTIQFLASRSREHISIEEILFID